MSPGSSRASCAVLFLAFALSSGCAHSPSATRRTSPPGNGAGGARAIAALAPRVGDPPIAIDPELYVRAIAPHTYVVTHVPFYASNVLVAKMPDGAALIASSPFETVATRSLVAWIQRALSPTRVVAVNTHFHFDGTGGNEAYAEAGVETWASTRTTALLLEVGPRMQREASEQLREPERSRVAAMRLTPATRSFPAGVGMALDFGGEQVRVVDPGPAHAPDNVVVHFPARGVVFGGCMIKSSASPGFLGHADLEHWPAAVEAVRALGARTVIPGHGAVGGSELFDLTLRVVRAAKAERDAAASPERTPR